VAVQTLLTPRRTTDAETALSPHQETTPRRAHLQLYTVGRRLGDAEARAMIEELRASSIRTLPVPEHLVLRAAALKIRHAIAYADAFAIATAVAHRASLVTGDQELRHVTEVPIVWIGDASIG
jgi:predicted nucleic acid-binding protein